MSITLIITIITAIVSFLGFSNPQIIDKYIFNGPAITKNKQWYRFISSGFIHADIMHLAFNMLAFYSFGKILEAYIFPMLFGSMATFYYVLLYVGGLVISSLPDYFKHKNDYYFRSLGASGAVSAVLFAFIVFAPEQKVSFFFLPGIPGYIFGLLYLGISIYLDKQGGGKINHGAHIWGAIFGIIFMLLFGQILGGHDLISNFLQRIGG